MSIKRVSGKIVGITDLTKTAKEIRVALDNPLDFVAGAFVNIFIDIDGEKERRAYSISSSDKEQNNISLAVRLTPKGKVTPIFWNKDLLGERIELMGPLGVNTADKMLHEKIYLFAFGVGAGVVKSLADHFADENGLKSLVIMTGSRFEDEIIYKEYFDNLAENYPKIKVSHIVSRPQDASIYKKGYIQDYISELDFSNSDIYVCGQESACTALVEKIKLSNPINCSFFVEAFH
ncbi:MAG: FAD-dependent oxidoreductase [Candidatus Paceibacterota bacterium]|jgi:NAD(P)H-flavin reductase